MPNLILAPNYRQSEDEDTTCGRCRFGGTGECRLYDFPTLPTFTCDSWQNGVQDNPHDGVMIALMVPVVVGEALTANIPDPLPLNELHLTLGYLGKTDAQFYGPEYLRLLISDFTSCWYEIKGVINGVGRFNRGDGDTEAFYASFDSPHLANFRHELCEFLANNGVALKTDHGFTPHITLSYIAKDAAAPIDNLPPIPLTFRDITIGWGDRLWSIPLQHDEAFTSAWVPPHLPYQIYGDSYYGDIATEWRSRSLGVVTRATGPKETAMFEEPADDGAAATPHPDNLNDEGFLKRWGKAVLKVLGLAHLTREIKDVESWDGAASQFESTADYCDACLINLNEGERDDWTQSLCKMPVREPGDGSDVFVRQAVYAAAARFNQLSKPADVGETEWTRAVSDAAKTLVRTYEQMDLEPPQAITDAARKRAIPDTRRDLVSDVMDALYEMSVELGRMCVLHAVQYDDEAMYAIMICEGQLYRAEIAYDEEEEEVEFGVWEMIDPVIATRERANSVTVSRAADGRYHYALVSATPFINRVGEIDSTQLFDSFIDYARNTGDYPRLDFLHFMDAFVLGQSYFVDRIGLAYVEMGWFDDTPIARSFAQAIMDDPIYWGNSIQYTPTVAPVMEEVAHGIYALVYRGGIHRFTSLLPEKLAANLFTMAAAQGDEGIMKHMNEDEFNAFMRGTANLSDEQRAAALDRIRTVNRAGESGKYVFRANTLEGQEAATEFKVDINLDEAAAQITEDLTERMTHVMREAVEGIGLQLQPLATSLTALTERVAAIEANQGTLSQAVAPVVEEHQNRANDAPAGRRAGALYVPRLNRERTPEAAPTLQTVAEGTVNKIFGNRGR